MEQRPAGGRAGRLWIARVRSITLLAVLLGLAATSATTSPSSVFSARSRCRADLAATSSA